MNAMSLFLRALAAQLIVDFLPLPWSGRAGVFRRAPAAGSALVFALVLLFSAGQLDWTLVLFAASVAAAHLLVRRLIERAKAPAAAPAGAGGPGAAPGETSAADEMSAGRALLLAGAGALSAYVLATACFYLGFYGRFAQLQSPGWGLLQELAAPLRSRLVLAAAIGYAFSLGAGGVVVGRLLAGLQREISLQEGAPGAAAEQREAGIRHAGRLIGFFEAFIVTTLVVFDQWGAIGFIIAAKAIGRFRQMEHRTFAEYFLIGTLANVSMAVLGGLLAKAALAW